MHAEQISLFTKPWPALSLDALASLVRGLHLESIELPVRPGFQVEPEPAAIELPSAVRSLADRGIRVASVAADPVPSVIEGCGMAGVPLIRVMARVMPGEPYTAAEARLRVEYASLEPALRDAGVRVGVQNHVGSYIPNALGLRALLDGLDPECFVAVWDAAHEALAGMPPELALDVVAPRLGMVNLKNGFWSREDAIVPGSEGWRVQWCQGDAGLANWPRVVSLLRDMDYGGTICLTAEYSDVTAVERFVAHDVAWALDLIGGAESSALSESGQQGGS